MGDGARAMLCLVRTAIAEVGTSMIAPAPAQRCTAAVAFARKRRQRRKRVVAAARAAARIMRRVRTERIPLHVTTEVVVPTDDFTTLSVLASRRVVSHTARPAAGTAIPRRITDAMVRPLCVRAVLKRQIHATGIPFNIAAVRVDRTDCFATGFVGTKR